MLERFQELVPRIRRYEPGDEARIESPEVEHALWIMSWLALWDRYFRYSVVGLDNLPRSGPGLLVSFHSFAVVDIFLLGRRIFLRDGRVIRGLTDKIVFMIPGLRDLFTTFGTMVGTQKNGLALLRSGALASCMPGGSFEWSRHRALRRQLRWGEHRGYARLAIRAAAPVIPTACPAADDAYFLPFDGWTIGKALQRALGANRSQPLPPLVIGLGPLPFPVRLTQYVGAPIWPEMPPEAADDPAAVAAFDARVRSAVADLLKMP